MDKDGDGARRAKLILATAAAWGGVFLLNSLRENSLEPIEDVGVLLASLLTFGLAFELYQALFGTQRPARARNDANSPETFARAHGSQPTISVDGGATDVDPATKGVSRLRMFVGWCGVTSLFFYFALARYVQLLSSTISWVASAALAVVGTIYFVVFVEPRLRPAFTSRHDRVSMMMAFPLALLVASNMALRLVNATPGLVLPPVSQSARVVGQEGVRHRRHKFSSFTVDLDLEDGGSASVQVSGKTFHSVQRGDAVELQRRVGLLGLPWCLADCFVIPQR